ncbi:MAG TPA: glycosyltransferase [Candidatus Angelobacter sp.]|jgi:spore maturation protein CgeB|nr:glycosyltransferase [Candidatus Angelobacter sp.]
MKITVFGLTLSSSWGNGHATPYRAIIRALDRLGHQVHFFEKDVSYYRSRRDFDSCDYCEFALYSEWAEVRDLALSTAADSDVVITASFLPEGRRINDEVLDLGRPLHVFYDLDTPVTLSGLRRCEVEYLDAGQIAAFDLVLSFTGGKALAALEDEYHARVVRTLYGCVDPDDYHRVAPNAQFQCDLSYMGTYSADRQAKVDALLLEPSRRHPEKQFLLAGSLYPWNWEWPGNVRRMEHVAPADHSRFYSSSRLTLNITRGEMAANGWCPSGRFFEAAACGTPLITDAWEGLDSFFDLDSEVRIVASPEDVQAALTTTDQELQPMAARARQRTLDEHTGAVRARQLLQYIEEARSGARALPKKEVAQ